MRSVSKIYVEEFLKLEKESPSNIIEIHNRPNYFHLIHLSGFSTLLHVPLTNAYDHVCKVPSSGWCSHLPRHYGLVPQDHGPNRLAALDGRDIETLDASWDRGQSE